MSLDGFDRCQRGGLILRWTPGGDLDKFVVMRASVPVTMTTDRGEQLGEEIGHAVGQLHEDGSITIDGGDKVLTPSTVEEEEAFGYTYVFTSGETFALPEWMP